MKRISIIMALLMLCTLATAQHNENKMFGTKAAPLATHTLRNVDSVYSRTILFDYLMHKGGAVSVSGYALTLTGSNAVITPSFRRITRTDSLRRGNWHALTPFTASVDSTKYELKIYSDANYMNCRGHQIKFVTATGSHTTKIEAIGLDD